MDNEKNIITKAQELIQEVKDYITNTEHFIFYWIDSSMVKEFISDNPHDYEELVSINVESVGSVNAQVRICLGPPEEGGENVIHRPCMLTNFRKVTKARWLEYNGKLLEVRMEEARRNLEYHKKKVADLEYFISKHGK